MSNILQKIHVHGDSSRRLPGYLRMSITDRCNFNCLYCGDASRRQYIPHERILRYEAMLRFARLAQKLGAGKIRITGGEPFVRKNCMEFLQSLRQFFPDALIGITTNGSLLEPFIEELCRLKLESINISLDSFDRETFTRITGRDALAAVVENIDRLLCRGARVKINAVAMRGLTDRQMDNFVHAAKTMPVDIRFIEFMPIGKNTLWQKDMAITTGELLALAREKASLAITEEGRGKFPGPARMYDVAGARGRLGFISPMSDHFCASCNRLRLTSDGKVRLCLFGEKEYKFARMLERASDGAIVRSLKSAWAHKPMGCEILSNRNGRAAASRHMAAIGG